jgi:hypothetical protein
MHSPQPFDVLTFFACQVDTVRTSAYQGRSYVNVDVHAVSVADAFINAANYAVRKGYIPDGRPVKVAVCVPDGDDWQTFERTVTPTVCSAR